MSIVKELMKVRSQQPSSSKQQQELREFQDMYNRMAEEGLTRKDNYGLAMIGHLPKAQSQTSNSSESVQLII